MLFEPQTKAYARATFVKSPLWMEESTLAKRRAATAVVNKSDAIRGILKQRPQATMKEIQSALKERGIKASDALVNKIKYGRKSSGNKKTTAGRSQRAMASKADAIRNAWNELGAGARPR